MQRSITSAQNNSSEASSWSRRIHEPLSPCLSDVTPKARSGVRISVRVFNFIIDNITIIIITIITTIIIITIYLDVCTELHSVT